MDDAFAFRTTTPLRRRIDPRIVRAAVAGTVVLFGIALFARWVIASERESFARIQGRVQPASLGVQRIPGGPAPDTADADADAQESLRLALAAARIASPPGEGFLSAGPAELAALRPGYMFVDGPSTIARVVSVASTADAWAAAVRAPSGTCYWIRVGVGEPPTTGTVETCTGAAALRASAPAPVATDRRIPV
jgi:hypothetical protein